ERWILGAMLLEGSLWHDVQQHVTPEDFTEQRHRKLAAVYWDHQRHEGETVLAELLSFLSDRDLTELAVELADEVDGVENVGVMVNEAVAHLQELRRRREEQKLMADLRRTKGAQTPEQDDNDEVSLLKKLQERARQPDLRRAL